MKKIHVLLILVVLLTLGMTTAAFAKRSSDTIEGMVKEFTYNEESGVCETLIIINEYGNEETISLPVDFDCEPIAILLEDPEYDNPIFVVIYGNWVINEDNVAVFQVDEIKVVDESEGGEGEGEGEGEGDGWGKGGVYCSEDSGRDHPIAVKISDKYPGISLSWVKEKVCEDGFGFGEVMLAIQTVLANPPRVVNGNEESVDPEDGEVCNPEEGDCEEDNSLGLAADEWLNLRKAGKGWGQIWKENNLVKKDKSDAPGLGRLNKTEKDKGPKEGKGPNKGEDHPSNKVHPNKENKNKNNKNDEDD